VDCKETAVFTTPANEISVFSPKAVFTSVPSERKYCTPLLFVNASQSSTWQLATGLGIIEPVMYIPIIIVYL